MERRASFRKSLDLPARFSIDSNQQWLSCLVKDFCAGGLLLSYSKIEAEHQKVPLGQLIAGQKLKITANFNGQELQATLQIVRIMISTIGVRFCDNADQFVQFLNDYHDKNKEKKKTTGANFSTFQKQRILKELNTATSEFLHPLLAEYFVQLSFMRTSARVRLSETHAHHAIDVVETLSLHAETITHDLIENTAKFYQACNAQTFMPEGRNASRLPEEKLTLVDKSLFEDWLNIKTIINKTESDLKDKLLAFQTRFEYLTQLKLNEHKAPFLPELLCEAIRHPLKNGHYPQDATRMAYRLFKSHVLDQLGALLDDLNRILENYKILPGDTLIQYLIHTSDKPDKHAGAQAKHAQAKSVVQNNPSDRGADRGADNEINKAKDRRRESATGKETDKVPPPSGYSSSLAHTQFLAEKAFKAATELLKLQENFISSKTGSAPLCNSSGETFSLDEVLSLLNGIQHQVAQNKTLPQVSLLKTMEEIIHNQYHGKKKLNEQQQYTLKIVDRVFQSITQNTLLRKEFQEQLNLLSILVFKALLLDGKVLMNEAHPVRRVINQLGYIGMKGSVFNPTLKNLVDNTVSHLLSRYHQDSRIFAEALPQLDTQINLQKRICGRNITRVKEACEGQFKIKKAQSRVSSEINSRFKGKRVPKLLLNFLDAGWKELLTLSLLKESSESKSWTIALSVIREVFNVLSNPDLDVNSMRFKPEQLLQIIKKGYEKVPSKQYDQTLVLQKLEPVILKQCALEYEAFSVFEPEENIVKTSIKAIVQRLKKSTLKQHSGVDAEVHYKKWLNRVKALSIGDWVKFTLQNDACISGHLIWIAEDQSRYVFANHQGIKVADHLLENLAFEFAKGSANLLVNEDLPVFDQGLDSLIEDAYSELAHGVFHDELTGMANQKEFERVLNRELGQIRNGVTSHVICYLSLDQFKVINTVCGYKAGDALIKDLSETVLKRQPAIDRIARLGTAEFGFLFKNSQEEAAFRTMDEVIEKIRKYRFHWEDKIYSVSASAGLLEIDERYVEVQHVFKDVESACLVAQEMGGNRIQTYHREDSALSHRQKLIAWVAKVDQAIDEDTLRLRYQCIQPIHANHKPHYEILIGLMDEHQNMVAPGDFICAAERYNRMGDVDKWVIRHAFEWMRSHQGRLNEVDAMCINLSGHSLNDETLMKYIFEEFTRTQIPCHKVCFEVTETIAVANLNDAADFIQEMKNIGCLFALDDFGTGMSSYHYLKHLPVDYIKIDGSFVRDINNNQHDFAMVKSITEMGHLMGKQVIAEYVLDVDILEKLKSIGVDYAQGYFVHKPEWLDQWER